MGEKAWKKCIAFRRTKPIILPFKNAFILDKHTHKKKCMHNFLSIRTHDLFFRAKILCRKCSKKLNLKLNTCNFNFNRLPLFAKQNNQRKRI